MQHTFKGGRSLTPGAHVLSAGAPAAPGTFLD